MSCEPAPAPPSAPAPEAELGTWPEAVADLPLATPATRVTLWADAVQVSNHELVATWPAGALERARAEGAEEGADWPRLEETLSSPAVAGMRVPALQTVLERARRAERAATGSGAGAGVFDLRVESAVPIAAVERVIYTAAQAGYGAPRIVLQRGDREHVLAWPTAPPRHAPTREAIEAALRAPETLEAAAPPEPRLELTATDLRWGADALDDAALERVLADVEGPVTLAVAPDVPFARVTAVLQRLAPRPVRLRVGPVDAGSP